MLSTIPKFYLTPCALCMKQVIFPLHQESFSFILYLLSDKEHAPASVVHILNGDFPPRWALNLEVVLAYYSP